MEKILKTIIIIMIYGLVVMLLWNWLMPKIFGLCYIDFFQALGLGLLSDLLIDIKKRD